MYIQITTRCNMHCDHCGYSCTAEGEDMSFDTFRAAIAMDTESVSIGGGEPTLHPLFWEFLGYAIGNAESVWMATNGSNTTTALTLAKLARKGVVGVALSVDDFHDPIDQRVIDAFTKRIRLFHYDTEQNDHRSIRDVSDKVIDAGRAAENQLACVDSNRCVCDEMVVLPNGKIKWCGCSDAPFVGTVKRGLYVKYRMNEIVVDCHKERND